MPCIPNTILADLEAAMDYTFAVTVLDCAFAAGAVAGCTIFVLWVWQFCAEDVQP